MYFFIDTMTMIPKVDVTLNTINNHSTSILFIFRILIITLCTEASTDIVSIGVK